MFPANSASRRAGKRRRLALQNLESRRLLAVSVGWDGAGQGSAELTYTIANAPSSLSQAETTAAIETALDAWSEVVDITFIETDQTGLRDSLDFSFTNIDGVGGTLAQAYFPDDINPARIAGDVQFDLAEAWEVGNSLGSQAFDLVYVAVHEIGHALGLDHSSVNDSVLAPYVSANQSFEALDDDDIDAILGLYAPAVVTDASDDDVDSDSVDETPSDTDDETSSDTEDSDDSDDDSSDTSDDNDDTDDTNDTDNNNFSNRRNRWNNRGFRNRGFRNRIEAEAPDHNYTDPTDVDGDSETTPLDALMVINQLNREVSGDDAEMVGLCDVSGDGEITPFDALTVINTLNQNQRTAGDETASGESALAANAETTDDVDDETLDDEVDEDTTDDETIDNETTDDETIDDGGVTDDCDGPHDTTAIRQQRFDARDADDNGLLTEDEVLDRFWTTLADADTDSDGGVSFDEFETFLESQETNAFAGRSLRHHHGHHATDQIFAAIGRGR